MPHLALVYILARYCTPWLAGWTQGTLLPLLQAPSSSSRFQFLLSHVLAFSVVPAFLAGLVNARFSHHAAEFAWLVPAVVLVYKIATFPTGGSVLYSQSSSPALHQYFGGGFLVPEFHDWHDLWAIVGSNPDMRRGLAQLTFTAPFYAGVAYSLAAWISLRLNLTRRVKEKVEEWKNSRFENQ